MEYFRLCFLALIFLLSSTQFVHGCRLICRIHGNNVWSKCLGNRPNCTVYVHPDLSGVTKLEFDVLSAPVDVRNFTNLTRISIKFPTKVHGCHLVISNHDIFINNEPCVSKMWTADRAVKNSLKGPGNIYWDHGAGAKWHGADTFFVRFQPWGGYFFPSLQPWDRYFF